MTRLSAFIWPAITLLLVLSMALASWYAWQRYQDFTEELSQMDADIASSTAYARELEATLAQTEAALFDERNRNEEFAERISRISYTVGEIKRVQETDVELLQKYSRVYFLNEHYVPKNLASIASKFLYDTNKDAQMLDEVKSRLERMLDEAQEDGLSILVLSAYRSFDTQSALKSSYRVTYGSGANKFSADQGYSEHQLGTTVDLTTPTVGATFTGFEKTPEYVWLTENAHKYGFILSYPANNGYYQYEPWHWRYVGRELAKDLYTSEKHFYDLDQREIDAYLAQFFD